MVEPHALVRADELYLQINRLHVSYLQADESPQKIEQRTKLENFIRKYLCLIAHGRKFIFPETAEILRCSVETKDNFSAYRASTAWNAIARYAANLVSQPWRKEFSVIQTFSGFYMHDIEENLAHAERLLDCMGYKRLDHTSLVLEQPIDLDAVISVSRDAIVAFVECQIMKEIWEGVYPQFECSWLEILNFRETHICSPESAIKSLGYHYHQNCFHQQQILSSGAPNDPYTSTPRFHQSNCLYGQAVSPQMNMASYYGYPSYASCSVPPQARYACVVNPQQVMGYPMSPVNYHEHAKSPVQLLPANGYNYPHLHHILPPPSAHNGYVIPQPVPALPQNYGCVVPTGQLIELDSNTSLVPPSHPARLSMPHLEEVKSSEVKNGNTSGSERVGNLYLDSRESSASTRPDNKSVRPSTLEDLKPRRNGVHVDHLSSSTGGGDSYPITDKHAISKHVQKQSARKPGAPAAPMQDGTGTWESWDYVYRNLESQGYNKDVGERGDILHNSSTLPRRGSTGSAGSSPNTNRNLVRNSRIMCDAEVSVTLDQLPHLSERIQSIRLNTEECTNSRGQDAVDSRSAVRDKISSAKDKLGPKGPIATVKTISRDHKREMDINSSVPKRVQENNVEDSGSFWECVFCTYHNNTERCVCEICGKSRQPGNEEKPLISGGRECPKCTLVNARNVVTCVACDESLKNSPTYI